MKIRIRMWSKEATKYFYDHINVLECLIQQNTGMYDHIADGMVFEQFIGIKDCRENEIFAGDIVRIHLGIDDFEEKEVIYDDENCCFTFKNTHEDPHCQFSGHYEIIGNIHEEQNNASTKEI